MGSQLAGRRPAVREARQIGDCGSSQRLAAYTVVTADSLEEALALAHGCPGLQHGFGIEVGALADPADALADPGEGTARTVSAV